MIVNEREGATPPEKRRTAAMAIAAAEVPRMTKQGHLKGSAKQLCRGRYTETRGLQQE